jgi:maltose alpha-D-glucosyltransferase/alpha-amylase
VLDVMRFWLRLGRGRAALDAIPYLVEREGTSCENLPETHVVLKKLRAVLDAEFPGRIFLAEANQWPTDVREYFGNGDECHMAFHFPGDAADVHGARAGGPHADRRHHGAHAGDPVAVPVGDLPAQPRRAHARDGDEDERAFMYGRYASDPRMRVNVGIRRRLAPLMDNGRDEIELMHALLMSLPGSPVLYYGDEIGMGDNIFLGDRNGVRTPMQWSADRNAGFSSVASAALYFPVIVDPPYGYQTVNVEAQESTVTSLPAVAPRDHPAPAALRSIRSRNVRAARAREPARARLLRRWQDEVILCVNNLARHAQYVELDLTEFEGWSPMELWSGQAFPTISTRPYPADAERPRLPLVPAAAAGRSGSAGRDRAGGRMTLPPVMDLLEQEIARPSGWQLRRGALLGAKGVTFKVWAPRAKDVVVHVAEGAGAG